MASASASRLRYQMLRPESESDDERERVILRPMKWHRFKGITVRKRFRLKVSMSWKRKLKKKVRFVCAKVMKRFKEGHVHFGDLFAGNYLFTQVNPTSLEYLEKKLSLSRIA